MKLLAQVHYAISVLSTKTLQSIRKSFLQHKKVFKTKETGAILHYLQRALTKAVHAS